MASHPSRGSGHGLGLQKCEARAVGPRKPCGGFIELGLTGLSLGWPTASRPGRHITRRGRHGLFLNIRIWYRSVFAFLRGQSLKMGILSNALIIKTCQNSIIIVFMLIQTQLYRSSYRGFLLVSSTSSRRTVTGLSTNGFM